MCGLARDCQLRLLTTVPGCSTLGPVTFIRRGHATPAPATASPDAEHQSPRGDSGVSPVLSRVLYYLVLSTRNFTPAYAITLNFKQIWPGFTGFMCLQLNTKYVLLSNASRRPHVSCRMSTATVLVMLQTSAGTRNVSCSSSLNSTHSFGTGIFSHDTSPRLKIKRHKSTWITP